jgi:hypothetical protein
MKLEFEGVIVPHIQVDPVSLESLVLLHSWYLHQTKVLK